MADEREWGRRVSQWKRSGLTAAQFCEGRDYAASTLRWHSSRLGKAAAAAETKLAMLTVRREAPRLMGHVVVELEDARVHVATGVDEQTLAAVFAALRCGEPE